METKGKVRSFADIFGEEITPDSKAKTGMTEIEISKLVPFLNHPFKLYEGERLNDMVVSIKELGVILPVVIRPKGEAAYEILSGHNRVNAAKIAGLEKIPVVIKEGLTEEEANLIVTETNLLQRSFSDLSHSERAIALCPFYCRYIFGACNVKPFSHSGSCGWNGSDALLVCAFYSCIL